MYIDPETELLLPWCTAPRV